MFDIPGSFKRQQLSHNALDMKHYMFTGGNRLTYNAWQFFNFLQKPSSWIKSIANRNAKIPYRADRISNDWDVNNRQKYTVLPTQDSLKDCSATTRNSFYAKIKGKSIQNVKVSSPIIDESMEQMLKDTKAILDKQQTNYFIILSPAICYTNPSINTIDLEMLKHIFGKEHVYNYTGINDITIDVNNFSDPGHFGLRVGFLIIQDIYKSQNIYQ